MSIRVNMEKARDIWRNRWREARKPLLEALDVEFMRAVEDDDHNKQREIRYRKQVLRDVTNTGLEDINESHQLTWVWPSCLGDK